MASHIHRVSATAVLTKRPRRPGDRARLLAALLLLAGSAAFAQEPPRDAGLVVVVDGTRGALVRWVLPAAGLPEGGYRVSRSVDGGPEQAIATLKPGQTGVALNPVWKDPAEAILRSRARFANDAERAVLGDQDFHYAENLYV